MLSYRLSDHTRVCVTCEGAVFLDLKRDAYVGISPEQARALAAWVADWPQPRDTATTDEAARALAESLCARGLLVRASVVSQRKHRIPLLPASEELIPWEEMPWRHIRPAHVIGVLRAFLITVTLLECCVFERIVVRHQQRRDLHNSSTERFDLERARALVSAYHHIRTWIFPRKDRCLLDSLTLLEFLNAFGIYPQWVIGVRLRPFAAHSWIQHAHWVLSGTPAFVRDYTPILVI